MKRGKIAVIGVGTVGASAVFALMMHNVGNEIVLVDVDKDRAIGETLDLQDAVHFSNTKKIWNGTAKDARDAQIVVITAGSAQKPGESRLDLVHRNIAILDSILKELRPLDPESIILVIANPVDVLTWYAQQHSGLPKNQVFGSGTYLDTTRLRVALGMKLQVADSSIHTFVLGEHGDSQFPAFSCSTIAGTPLLQFPGVTREELDQIANETKNKAMTIINKKRFTQWGIGACCASICRAILYDSRQVMPLSTYVEELGVCLGMPVVVGAKGVLKRLSCHLGAEETEKLKRSAETLKKTIESVIQKQAEKAHL